MAAIGSVVVPPLNSDREAAYDIIVLVSKATYLYTIPSFSAISLKLRHMSVRTEDESGVNLYDVFFHEFPGCSSLEVTHPVVIRVTNGCIVKVKQATMTIQYVYDVKITVFVLSGYSWRSSRGDYMNYNSLKLLSEHEVFVAYAWHWMQSDCSEEDSNSESDHSSLSSPTENDLDFDAGFTTHTNVWAQPKT